MTPTRYYYADEHNQPVGPFAKEDLEKMVKTGVIDPETMVCLEGGADWISLASLISASQASLPTTPPPPQKPKKIERTAKVEKNANAAAAAAVIFPLIAIILTLGVAANPVIFAMARGMGTGFLLFLLFFAIGVFGPINAIKLLRVPGIFGRKPTAVVFAWIGIALFVTAVGLFLLVGFGLESEMARRTG